MAVRYAGNARGRTKARVSSGFSLCRREFQMRRAKAPPGGDFGDGVSNALA